MKMVSLLDYLVRSFLFFLHVRTNISVNVVVVVLLGLRRDASLQSIVLLVSMCYRLFSYLFYIFMEPA